MNYSSSFNQFGSMETIKNLSSKDFTEQQEGINSVKKMLEHFNPVEEPLLISIIPMILELSSEKRLFIEIEILCGELVKKLNSYAFELIFNEILKVFKTVKFQAKIQGLRMVCIYANTLDH